MVTARSMFETRETSGEDRTRDEPPRNGDGSDKATPARDYREMNGVDGEGGRRQMWFVDAASIYSSVTARGRDLGAYGTGTCDFDRADGRGNNGDHRGRIKSPPPRVRPRVDVQDTYCRLR